MDFGLNTVYGFVARLLALIAATGVLIWANASMGRNMTWVIAILLGLALGQVDELLSSR